ncbi:MAG: uracil-DNA glycosylase [Ignavibacteria bacterium RIFOXYB2_FULL_35_12]|nr:MAG: uracil-DNA glycosylase [Ignavibacteria bacterium GWA2_36_19]OGU50758.1 MAG: uracil-DNA glycosylase [Ignavibacteria bacterium GWC2_35_8]OGU55984.1 MAG: uracil-DNA glycosylase [Ignavibacteria bacterium GWF2_35_20]OGU80720.1 MAG: uracil-DNA glycosylase [Ignavibacteria bacterium RIFOXYA2_FULL_35_9]OGU86227.1 MAG: uracil-DNA glycosylase [Ignavibacteria bacterium RIFOXYA12_FULL_35_25]OGU92679.1 MAG: uracil-DNA glycosylase [Ignavibacteria bacterium RIFOXYC12_FULL_35_11]OGU95611.1 MAG: uracil
MPNSVRSEVVKALKDQKEIFGDELFTSELFKSEIITEKVSIKKVNEEPELFADSKENWETTQTLDDLNRLICNCTKCDLHKGRNKFVFGVGNPKADVLLIGEGPGAEEDKQGEPFVGRAGQLLNDILKAINFTRQEVYIANIVKCRPPGNRTPLPNEMDSCLPYLVKQIELIKPKLILCLGLVAAGALLKKKDSLGKMRGKIFEFNHTKVMVTYHPAALLRNPNFKRGCWEDVKAFRKLYDEVK